MTVSAGAVYAQVVSLLGIWAGAFNLSGASSSMTGNTALVIGGGLFWRVPQDVSLSSVAGFDPRASCVSCGANGVAFAGYGADFATDAAYLQVLNNSVSPPVFQTSGAVVAGQLVQAVTDFYRHALTSDSTTQALLVSSATLQVPSSNRRTTAR